MLLAQLSLLLNCSIVCLNFDLLSDSVIDFLGQRSRKADLYITYLYRVIGIRIRWGEFGIWVYTYIEDTYMYITVIKFIGI